MPKRVSVSKLNASTIDILNVIRQNASYEYQSTIPEISTEADIPKVGEMLYGYPALANQFINALVNRIALVRVKSATFNNPYRELKKGYLEFGETVEEVFVNICKAREFSVEKAEQREFKRSLPDVRAAFHVMNYRTQYPITIQDEDLRMAFTSADGVQDLIARVVDAVYTAAEYDEYLIFKYLLIKAVANNKIYLKGVDTSDVHNAAVAFRSVSNQLTFMNTAYNVAGVHTVTPRDDQYIFMSADYNAEFDVNVLSAAFNMDKADFMGHLKLIDSWNTFDNDRFSEIMDGSDQIELVTDAELSFMANVQAVIVDREWFQVYDNLAKMTEQYAASGLYWNYFYNTWKTVSSSPFSNAVAFIAASAATTAPASIAFTVTGVSRGEGGTPIAVTLEPTTAGAEKFEFIQNADATGKGIGVHKYGAVLYPTSGISYTPTGKIRWTDGTVATYTASGTLAAGVSVGTTVTMTKDT